MNAHATQPHLLEFIAPFPLETCTERLIATQEAPMVQMTHRQRTAVGFAREGEIMRFEVKRVPGWLFARENPQATFALKGYLRQRDKHTTLVTVERIQITDLWKLYLGILLKYIAVVLLIMLLKPGWFWIVLVLGGLMVSGVIFARLMLYRHRVLLIVCRALEGPISFYGWH